MAKPNDKASKMPPTAPKQASYDGDVVTDLKPDDVLLGRGIGPNEHQGNVKFREVVGSLRSEYLATNKRKAKDKIAHKTIKIIKARTGRFLRKLNAPAAKPVGAKDVYVIADEKAVVEKTKQALRFLGRKKHSDSNEDQYQEDRVASPSTASVGAEEPSSGLPTHFGGAFDQMATFPHQGGGALPLNYSRESHQQTLLLANELNRDSASRSQPSLLLDATLQYLSEQHQQAPSSHQHTRLFSESQALGPTLLKAQQLQQIQAMLLLPPGAPRIMDSMSSSNLPFLQQHHNQSFVSFFPNSARQDSSQFESLQSSMLPSTASNRLVQDGVIAAALRRASTSSRRESQPQGTRDSSSSAYPLSNPGQPRPS
jgi:hypothetical protein